MRFSVFSVRVAGRSGREAEECVGGVRTVHQPELRGGRPLPCIPGEIVEVGGGEAGRPSAHLRCREDGPKDLQRRDPDNER